MLAERNDQWELEARKIIDDQTYNAGEAQRITYEYASTWDVSFWPMA
jgi:hypothetical protein